MTTPFWCLLVTAFVPYVIAPIGGYFRTRQFGTLDNRNPRVQAAKLEGAGARAQAAQENAWEALSVFGVAVIVNHLAGGAPGTAAAASVIYLVTRILHPIAYIADLDKVRSGVFLVGMICIVTLFVGAARA